MQKEDRETCPLFCWYGILYVFSAFGNAERKTGGLTMQEKVEICGVDTARNRVFAYEDYLQILLQGT